MFDGEPALSSAVFLSEDGSLLTGQRAWQAAVAQPERFIPAPRRSVEQQVPVAGGEVEALDLVAATLRRVAEEAHRAVGFPIEDVRLVVPAGWGPRRRTWMRHAAHRAGLPQPRLVEAPVAVAGYLLASGVQLPVGSFIVVCDVGGGVEVSVLRRGPAGFEVLATLADPDAGGAAVDRALTAALTGDEAGPGVDEGARWALTASVQTAKHALTDHAAVTVPLPGGPVAVVNGQMLEQAARPILQRTAQLTTEAIAAAEVDPASIAGVYCAGGAVQMPLVEKVLTENVGIAPVVVAEPGLAAARGAAETGAAGPGGDVTVVEPPPVPPVRRAVAIAAPGFASLGLVSQFLLTAEWNGGFLRPWTVLNWGELAMAAVFAVIASLAAGTVIASAIATRSRAGDPISPGGQVGTGILASASLGVAVAGMYAVVGSLYIGADVSPFLRWALLPVVPIVAVAAVMALVAARQWRTPRGGWSELLAFPTGSVVTGAVGMALIQYSLVADRWPDIVLWIDIAGRVGGLLLGVGVVMAVVSPLLLRVILAAPLGVITAAIVSRPASGILGVIYGIAVALWWIRQLWTRIVRPDRQPVRPT
ncbi:Hsp70 family protein [Micromonospora sp. ATA51]|uniref:Hsp70 family protein n=1 Tax=Micromonospora sp. ATA51 TaxID=2806098 RepID=UPI001EE476F8|nr:Hsp70 family protein [Micromonospora sp. ATA51]